MKTRKVLALAVLTGAVGTLASAAFASDTVTNEVWPIIHGKVGEAITINLAEADEVPREWTNATFYLMGAEKDSRFVTDISQLQFSNTTGRLQWTPEPAQAGRYHFLFVAAPDTNTLMAIRRVVDIEAPAITTDTTPLGKQLTQWWKEGTAAGLVGDAYDNRDDGHSVFNTDVLPQLTRIKYPDEYKQRNLHKGAQIGLLFNHVTVGNCSMAGPAETGGCLARTLLLDRRTAEVLAAQYRRNHLYVYPEHLDHDPGHNGQGGGGYGDLLSANTPFIVISQGSSGSDQPFVNAWFWTLASFRPEVKRVLTDEGMLMPAMQMIFRMCNKNIAKPEDYLTGRAHPTAFEGANVDTAKMAEMAHAMRLDSLPPMIQLRVVEEDRYREGRDFFDPGSDEEVFSTPYAISRVFHAGPFVRRIVVSAEGSYALNGRVESYQWVVLRGNSDRIRITPRNKENSVVEIRVGYQPRRPIAPGAALESNRIDIGAFARTARAWSPPAFITFYTLDNEARTYESDGRLVDIGYDVGETAIGAADVWNWSAVVDLILNDKPEGPASVLQRAWSGEELAAVRDAAREIKPAAASTTADGKLVEMIKASRPALGASFESKLVAAFNRFKNDPEFCLQNAAVLAALPESENRRGWLQERGRLIAMGVAEMKSDRLVLSPARGSLDKLTAYERIRIERLNLAALRALYPGIIAREYKPNYVDRRLTVPKAWRDVYRYDTRGHVTGWKRYAEDGMKTFTADGHLVTETDKLGRAVKARAVVYARKQTGPLTVTVETVPGLEVRYEYVSDQDFVGRVVP